MIRIDELSEEAPRAATWLKLESVRSGMQFAALRREWNVLLEQSDAGLFNAWEWLYPWYRRIGADRELMILAARDERGALVGLMPLCLSKVRAAGRSLRRLSWLGETHVGSDYLDVIARRGMEEQVTRAFIEAIRAARGEWDVLDLIDLDQDSKTLAMIREVFGSELYRHEVTERYTCPFEKFGAGEKWDDFLKRTARRDNYLRRKKWLEKQPGYQVEKVTDPGKLAQPMADFFRLHAQRWAGDGGSQGIKGAGVEAFHRDATQYLGERGLLRMYTMRVGAQAVASVYGIVHRGKFIYFQSGYDPEWRNKSVGLVLVGETFKDSLEAGLTEYDFLRGTETYKSDWTTKERKTLAVRVCEKRSKGAWLSTQENAAKAVRELAKRALPTNLVERIRRLRRKQAAI
jgi:CelD/BcsL family acetyltransferase involved in cellulose biosynthesis